MRVGAVRPCFSGRWCFILSAMCVNFQAVLLFVGTADSPVPSHTGMAGILLPGMLFLALMVVTGLLTWAAEVFSKLRPGKIEEQAGEEIKVDHLLALVRQGDQVQMTLRGAVILAALGAGAAALHGAGAMMGGLGAAHEGRAGSGLESALGIVVFLVAAVLFYAAGFVLPSLLARRTGLKTAAFLAVIMAPLHNIFGLLWSPRSTANGEDAGSGRVPGVASTGGGATDDSEELHTLLAENHGGGPISKIGRDILLNALELSERVARDIMTPRNEVVYLDLTKSFDENLRTATESQFTRFPLCEGHLDQSLGLVHIKDLIPLIRNEKPELASIKRDLIHVPEMIGLEKLLGTFLSHHAHLAMVLDEYGGAVGIVTLDNVMEELVGDIQDEFDTADEEFKRVNDDEFLVKGTFGIHEMEDLAGLEISNAEVSTLGGFITHQIGHLPRQGEQVRIKDFVATVNQSDGRRVLMVHLKRQPLEEEEVGITNGKG